MSYTNSIELAKAYVPVLDAVYKAASLTAKLDGNEDLIRAGANANEMCIPMISMDGLADYSRNGGYVDGDVTLEYETHKCNFDRGRMFQTDVMDNLETAGVAFGQLAGEFIRTKVVPEEDAFRFASYAGWRYTTAGGQTITPTIARENLTTGEQVVKALSDAVDRMTNDEVPEEDRHLFITPTLYGMVRDLDTTKSRAVLDSFASITKVPQSRFYSAIEQLDGTSQGEKKGGYKKADGAVNLNFIIIHKPALIQFAKHTAPKVISPDVNPKADAYAFGYRKVSIADIYWNKAAGVYISETVEEPQMAEVRYIMNGDIPSDVVEIMPDFYDVGSLVSVEPIPTTSMTEKDGVAGTYSFDGWTTTDVTIDDDGNFIMPANGVIFYGTWTFAPQG